MPPRYFTPAYYGGGGGSDLIPADGFISGEGGQPSVTVTYYTATIPAAPIGANFTGTTIPGPAATVGNGSATLSFDQYADGGLPIIRFTVTAHDQTHPADSTTITVPAGPNGGPATMINDGPIATLEHVWWRVHQNVQRPPEGDPGRRALWRFDRICSHDYPLVLGH